MAKAVAKSADQLIVDALKKALQQGDEARLITSGKKPEGAGLFPDEKGARKAAIQTCLYESPALLKVVRTEEVQVGKRKQVHRFVAITPDGINYAFSKLPREEVGELFAKCSQASVAALHEQQAQLDKILQARQQILENVQALVQQLAETAGRMQAGVDSARERSNLLKARLDSLPLPSDTIPLTPTRPPLRKPATEQEAAFRQRYAQEWVFAWQDSANEGREPIERALFNIGAEQIGHPGERVAFAGRIHECDAPVFPGDPVVVVRAGWLLRDESGGYLLAHAQVKVAEKSVE